MVEPNSYPLQWCASLGGGAEHTEQGRDLTRPICSRSALFTLTPYHGFKRGLYLFFGIIGIEGAEVEYLFILKPCLDKTADFVG